MPGPAPQRGPPLATGGHLPTPWKTSRCGSRANATGQKKDVEPKLINILHWNAEGAYKKKLPLAQRLQKEDIHIACLQETYLKESQRFSVRGYQVYRQDREGRAKGGVAILVKNSIPAQEFTINTNDQAEIHGVNIKVDNRQLKIINVYCPQDKELSLDHMIISEELSLIVGDFNSHSEAWGYPESDRRGEEVEDWQIEKNLLLLNDPDDTPTFFSRRWLTSTTPDLAFATNDVSRKSTRMVLEQLGGSDHKPVKISIDMNFKPHQAKAFPRWNFKRANWEKFATLTDQLADGIRDKREHLNKKVRTLNQHILKAARESIPRGARRNYRPYWTEELQKQEDDVQEAREKVEEDPIIENNIALKEATAKHRRTLNQEARRSWVEKTEELNLDKEGQKLWRLAKALNDEGSRSSPITLLKDGQMKTGKQAADELMQQYAENSDLEVTAVRTKEVREALDTFTGHEGELEINQPFTLRELQEAMLSLKKKKAPGVDQITNEMLLHLGPKAKKKLLQMYNESWKSGIVPQIWKEATMVPVHKKGKEKSKADSYRPISLLSCVGKLLERMINTRLMWHLEEKNHISPEQAAFRSNHSTEDQVTYLAQAIEDGFQEKKHTLTVWIDMEKAFEKVWKDGLKLKMRQCGVHGRMFRWIDQYLNNRKARTRTGQHYSRKKVLKQGVPQGGVLSPTLFLVFIKDIIHRLPRNVKGAIYADDLAIWCSEEHLSTANYRLNMALREIEAWTNKWQVKINERKTTYTIFSLSSLEQKANLKFNSHELQHEDTPTYLGVTLDRRLTWKHQLQKSQARAKGRLALMKKLSGTQWGADQRVQKRLYVGRVRPVMEYGLAATSTAAKSHTDKIARIQNQAMRIMTGAMRTTPIKELETVTGLHSMEDRRDIKVMTQAAKYKRLESHPMNNRMKKPTKGRLKRSSFIHESRIRERRNPELLEHTASPLPKNTAIPAWKKEAYPILQTTIPGVCSKGTQADLARRALTLAHIQANYPPDQWTHAYTDGSATEATRDGGGGVYITYTDGEERCAIATGKFSTNFRAEADALKKAAERLTRNHNRTHDNIVIFTDALSVLQALQNPKSKELDRLSGTLATLAKSANLTLQWIPAHCGVQGNEIADALAKEGGKLDQTDTSVPYKDEKTIVRSIVQKRWSQQHPAYNKNDSYHILSRADQVIILRLRTGHNRLNAHLYNKLKIGQSEMCPCHTAAMTTEHLLQHCHLHDALRNETWPEAKALNEKLHGGQAALERTAAFARQTGVSI